MKIYIKIQKTKYKSIKNISKRVHKNDNQNEDSNKNKK